MYQQRSKRITNNQKLKIMTTNEIKTSLTNGVQFCNEVADWFSLVNVSQNRFILVIKDKTKIYKDLDSVSKKISNLLKRGY